ncbi:hypothetical protein [Desulfolucanica intricata]|uniref:hypothetical protein n=1 Tax=Desulfolucanica intricata TaxID=1285191 RepID=UPI000AC55AC9|nr:hypothetical protein [Desulfolucanica intricata]
MDTFNVTEVRQNASKIIAHIVKTHLEVGVFIRNEDKNKKFPVLMKTAILI